VNPTDEEVRVVTDIWLATFASDVERASAILRRNIVLSLTDVLRAEEPRVRRHPSDDVWLAVRSMLAAYRAGRAAER
jgi:hypothetical protein